jgi:hypothetical protein
MYETLHANSLHYLIIKLHISLIINNWQFVRSFGLIMYFKLIHSDREF